MAPNPGNEGGGIEIANDRHPLPELVLIRHERNPRYSIDRVIGFVPHLRRGKVLRSALMMGRGLYEARS